MRPIRTMFLWASTNPWISERLPRRRFAQRAVRRFMPGERLDDALAAAHELNAAGLAATITELGENVDRAGTEAVVDRYLGALKRIQREGLDCQLSVKPTHLGLDAGVDVCREALATLADRAGHAGTVLWVDMEGSAYTDATLKLYRELRTAFPHVGVCVQANLRRTATDVTDLAGLLPSIRLVKGAYLERDAIAWGRKRDVDRNYLELAKTLLRDLGGSPACRLAIATHDVRLIRSLTTEAEEMGRPRTSFEVQMLYGIRTEDQMRLAADGFRVRVLISYGDAWFPWYMRRLAERPANVWFVARSLVSR